MPRGENTWVDKLRLVREPVPGAVGCDSKLMNQHCLLNKVYLNRNTHKTRLWINQLTKTQWPEACRNLTLYFPRDSGSVFAKRVFPGTP